jgi:hypothetical protein
MSDRDINDVRNLRPDTERTRQTHESSERPILKSNPDAYKPDENVVVPGSAETGWVYVGLTDLYGSSPKEEIKLNPGKYVIVRRTEGEKTITKEIPYEEFKQANPRNM